MYVLRIFEYYTHIREFFEKIAIYYKVILFVLSLVTIHNTPFCLSISQWH